MKLKKLTEEAEKINIKLHTALDELCEKEFNAVVTMKVSELQNGVLAPEFYNVSYQLKRVKEKITGKDLYKSLQSLNEILRNDKIAQVRLNPVVRTQLTNILNSL